jgi:LysR substrate binding domain
LVNDSNAHLACALAGLGLVHTLDFNVRASIDRGELVVVLKEYCPRPLEVFLVYPPSRQRSTKVRVFGDWVTQIFGRLVQQQGPVLRSCDGQFDATRQGVSYPATSAAILKHPTQGELSCRCSP